MNVWLIAVAGALATLGCSPEPPRQSSPAATRPGATLALREPSSLDALLAYVPTDALAVVAIDLEQARRSPALIRGVERLLAQLGHDLPTGARALVVARISTGAGEPPADLLILTESSGPRLLGPSAVVERANAAHLGASLVEAGELRDALVAARGDSAAFGVVRMTESLRTAARALSPDLATATWFTGSLAVGTGITLTGIGAFPDLTTAARVAAAVDLGKSFALGELRSKEPVAARAIEKLFARPVGATLRVTATFDEAEATALLGLLR